MVKNSSEKLLGKGGLSCSLEIAPFVEQMPFT